MALKVGDLYVSLTANTQKLQGQLNGAAKKIEAVGRTMKAVGKDASEMSNMVVAAMGAAFAAASSKDAVVKKQVDNLKNAGTALAVEVARVALPVLQKMTEFVQRVVAAFQQMTPEQKAMVTTFFSVAVAVTGIATAAAKLAPAFNLAGSAIRAAAALLGTFSLPVILGIVAVIGVIGFLREAWDQNLGGIREKAAEVWGWIVEKMFVVTEAFSGAGSSIKETFKTAFAWVSDKFRSMAATIIRGVADIARTLGMESLFDVNALEQSALDFTNKLPQMMVDGADALMSGAVEGVEMLASGVGTALQMSGAGLEKIASDIKAKLSVALPKPAKTGPMKDLGAQVDYGRLRADKMKESLQKLKGGDFNLKQAIENAGGKHVPKALAQFNEETFKTQKGVEDLRDALHKLGAKGGEASKFVEDKIKADEEAKKLAQHVDRLRADRAPDATNKFLAGSSTLGEAARMAGVTKGIPAALEGLSGATLTTVTAWEDLEDQLAQIPELNPVLRAWIDQSRKTFEENTEKQKQLSQHVDRLRADKMPQATQKFLGGGTFDEAARVSGITSEIPAALRGLSGSTLTTVTAWEDLEDQLAQVRDLNPLVRALFDGMRKTFEDGVEQQKQLEKQRKDAISGLQDQIIGSMGKVGGILQAATGPLAQALGPIGALIGVVLELVKGSKGFENLVSAIDGVIQGLSDAVGQVFEPVAVLVNALQPIVAAVGTLISQVLPLITTIIEPLLPLFIAIGAVVLALSPILAFVVRVVELLLIPVLVVLEVAIRTLFGALQTVAVIVLGVVVGVVNVWNGIVSAIQAVLTWISAFEIAGQRPFAFLADWATSLEAAKGPAAQYQQQLNDTMAMTYESAMTQAKAFGALGEATDQLAGSMTNAASGFKVDLARFNATGVGSTPGAPAEASVGGYYGDTYVTIVSNDPEVIWDKVENVRRRKNFQSGRGLLGGLPAFGS